MRKRIQEEWEKFHDRVMPLGAGEIQRRETRRAFFAGAAALFSILNRNVEGGSGEPTADEMAVMDDLSEEIQEYGRELARDIS